ncbi:hypothetical protein QTJ16_000085 [Diplocarpon rosae]|uniref:Uncharacterized protein n=1 Tax=Diplocarpon rosae TaxID=946125 RepID=A0AAD9WFC2_9HELO|nr:hypothetical protein QTJ16_000085 [Diplocarpon rosae]PBP17222.1 hypothetical protein BUE80_DR012105 [Diplocarpon rosae]
MENPQCEPPQSPNLAILAESSTSLLRFPAPVADERVTSWVETITTADMSARSELPSDEGILGESAYEFVDTDEESRDDNATESVASTDYGRPEDVASLADTEGDESGDEDSPGSSSIPDLPALDHTVEQAFNTPTIGRSSAMLLSDIDRPPAESIEFEEPYTLGAENVSVKHTVADLNEEQTAKALKDVVLQDPPKRMVVTIRQTMSKQGLSTRDPLRILYVGSHSAKQDIIHKIASCVTASVECGKRAQRPRQSSSQLYNVVPVSAFGSERTPEIELMHSSGYQIKVEDCALAENLRFEDQPEKPDVIKMTFDEGLCCHSVPEGPGFIIEPHWELPHVAVFYCSDGDKIEARRTRTIARRFMSRHSVASIVISHKQLFERGQCMSLDQHSIHMCLESRDNSGRGNIIHQRLPIDLASFLNIDARQMNRNLAYLTGLHATPHSQALPNVATKRERSLTPQDLDKTTYRFADRVNLIRNRHGATLWRAIVPLGMLALSVFIAALTGLPSFRSSRLASPPAISINSKVMPAVSISSTATLVSSASAPRITSTSVSLSAKTSVRTVTVTRSMVHASGPNSLSVVRPMEIAKVSRDTSVKPANKSFVCTAELLGDREILIRIPSATKLSWLAKEAISVNITRNNVTVDTERAYSSDEGIVLLISTKESHGVLNISIATTKKPRINETFQVDFGSTASWQLFLRKISSHIPYNAQLIDTDMFSHLFQAAEHLAGDAVQQSQASLQQLAEARKAAIDQAASAGESLTDFAKSISLEAARRSAIISKAAGIQLAGARAKLAKTLETPQRLREPLDEGIVKAQVHSKLLWLKLQGKDAEYRDYQRRASEFTRTRSGESQIIRGAQKANRLAKKVSTKTARTAARETRT